MKKIFNKTVLIIVTAILSLSFLTTFSTAIFEADVKLIYKLSNNIYIESDKLNKTLLIFKSSLDLSKATIKSTCNTETKLINKKNNTFLYEFKINDKNCTNSEFYIQTWSWIIYNSNFKLNLISNFNILSVFIDYSSWELQNFKKTLDLQNSKLNIFTNFSWSVENDNYWFLKKKRLFEELKYKTYIVEDILNKRKNKYIIPVPWYNLPTKNLSKIPNAWRPYRNATTDWIHHSWDIDTPFGTKVVSLDDWIIVRIVKNWDKSDFSNLRKWNNLTTEDKMRNLDILRWNQVWIKTMKWEVVMYAHLDKVADSIKEWTTINKWDFVWTIWASWVPEEWYNDFHLDFSICQNPYSQGKAWTYQTVDYMAWPWKYIWKSSKYIIEHQNELFE